MSPEDQLGTARVHIGQLKTDPYRERQRERGEERELSGKKKKKKRLPPFTKLVLLRSIG